VCSSDLPKTPKPLLNSIRVKITLYSFIEVEYTKSAAATPLFFAFRLLLECISS